MQKLVLRRRGHRLEAPSQEWGDLMEDMPEGVDLNVSVTRARSLSQLGTYWGLLSFVLSHGPEWLGKQYPTKDELSDALQLKVGFVRQIALTGLPEGMTYAVPASKSFSECAQHRFNEYFMSATAVLDDWCGFDCIDMYKHWLRSRKLGAA